MRVGNPDCPSLVTKMAAQSQGIKKLMAAEKEAAHVVANARKSELGVLLLLATTKCGCEFVKRSTFQLDALVAWSQDPSTKKVGGEREGDRLYWATDLLVDYGG